MKRISQFTALFILFASFSVPLFASAACISPQVSGNNGMCYFRDADGFFIGGTPDPGGSGAVSSSGGSVNVNALTPYSTGIISVINTILVPVFMALAFIVFLWGVYKSFILGADNETERTAGKQFVLWGIIGFVIILSVWGLVALVSGTLGLPSGGAAPKPPML